MPIQLPDDAVSRGYVNTKPYQFEQIFYSKSKNFKGTGKEFIKAGYAYEYIQINNHKRLILNTK